MGVYGIEGPEAMVSGVIFSRSIDCWNSEVSRLRILEQVNI